MSVPSDKQRWLKRLKINMSYERSGKILTAIRRQVNSDFNSPNRQNGQNGQNRQNGQNSNIAVYFGLFRFTSCVSWESSLLRTFVRETKIDRDLKPWDTWDWNPWVSWEIPCDAFHKCEIFTEADLFLFSASFRTHKGDVRSWKGRNKADKGWESWELGWSCKRLA